MKREGVFGREKNDGLPEPGPKESSPGSAVI